MPLMRLLRALYSILIRCRLDVNLEVDFSVVSTTNESKSLKLFILSDLFAYIRKKLYLCTRKAANAKPLRSAALKMTGKDKQMKYTVVIEEILRKEVAVEAKDAEEAEEIVEALYSKGEIVLDAGDFIGEPTITCK